MLRLLIFLVVAITCGVVAAQPRTLIEWKFDKDGDTKGWVEANHLKGTHAAGGALHTTVNNWDPFLFSPEFSIPATPSQEIQVAMRTKVRGTGEFYWTNTLKTQYSGFSPGKETPFEIEPSADFRVSTVRPFWQAEKTIIKLRLDLAGLSKGSAGDDYEIAWVRVVDRGAGAAPVANPSWRFTKGPPGWTTQAGDAVLDGQVPKGATLIAPPLQVDAPTHGVFSVRMSVTGGRTATVGLAAAEVNGLSEATLPIIADGKMHVYNLPVHGASSAAKTFVYLSFRPTDDVKATGQIEWLKLAADPQGPAELEVAYLGLDDALPRVGGTCTVHARIGNRGGRNATDVQATLELPAGVSFAPGGQATKTIPAIEFGFPEGAEWHVVADKPTEATFTLRVAQGSTARLSSVASPGVVTSQTTETILPSLNLPKASYVPEPRPVQSDYEVGALYFPGWATAHAWDPIRNVAPVRKPVLGYYDEGNPECVDWQIKWAAEHGIKFFMVDWYWSAGGRSLEHWVKAYQKAKYRSYLKWCMMWANHNGPNTHSEADQRQVTQYWLDNYFNTPEYYRINDMPVVMIWSPEGMDRDMAGKGGAKRLLDISQEMAKAAGYKGIWFVAMKWPEASTDPAIIKGLADKGFAMTSIYHYMDGGEKAKGLNRFPFELCAETSYPFWKAWQAADTIPFLPNLATGWDSRPWHGEGAEVIYGRSVPLFRRICEDAKRFADETGIKRMVLAPLNEWGEGSYAEPNKEFGFGMFDAVRDVFCKKPAEGWPVDIAPSDVGLGPYDFNVDTTRTAWDFRTAKDGLGWGPMMGLTNVRLEDGALRAETTDRDPAFSSPGFAASAKRFRTVEIEMAIDKPGDGQLFWGTGAEPISEASSVTFPMTGDGQFHVYRLPVGNEALWRGMIVTLRLDPGSTAGAQVAIRHVKLVETP